MRRASFAILIAAAAAGAAACGPDLPERLWRSEHVRYFSREGDASVCPAILDQLEEHNFVIADALGITEVQQTIVSYYKFEGADDFGRNAECGAGATGCAANATVRSSDEFDRHELVHAYVAPYGLPPPLLKEGVAAALACERHPHPVGSWRDVYAADPSSPALHAAGAWLVGHLLRTDRAAKFMSLYGGLPGNATAEAFADRFEAIYGMTLDAAWTIVIEEPRQPMRCPWECGRPAFAPDGQAQPLVAACGAGSVQLSIDLPDGGVSHWRIDGGGRFAVRSCDGFEEPHVAVASGAGGPGGLLAPLAPGRYFIDAEVEPGGAPVLAVSVAPGEGLSWVDCAFAPAVTEDPASYGSLSLFYPSSTGARYTLFAGAAERGGQLTLASDDPLAHGFACPDCGGADCPRFDAQRPLALPPPPPSPQVLRLASPSAATVTFTWF
jgi:hypothetical protein